MSYGSLLSQSPISSPFDSPLIRITGPSHGASVTVTGGGITKTAQEVSNGVWEVSVDKGSWSVSAGSLYTTSNVSVNVPKIYTTSLSIRVSTILEKNSWSVIREIADANSARSYWSVGDTKKIILNGTLTNVTGHGTAEITNNEIYSFIVDITGVLITFAIGKAYYSSSSSSPTEYALCYPEDSFPQAGGAFSMNDGWSNVGGWKESKMRNSLLGATKASGSLWSCFPSELKASATYSSNYTDNGQGKEDISRAVTLTNDYVALASEYEVFGEITNSNPAERNHQSRLDYYRAGNSASARKYFINSSRHNESYGAYWLRSVHNSGNQYFWCMVNYGDSGAESGTRSGYYGQGIMPLFYL